MRYTWTNTILFVLLIGQMVSGLWGLTSGSETFSWLFWWHAVGGYAIVASLFWKGIIIFDAIKRRFTLSSLGFIALAILVLAILISGILWTHGGPRFIGRYSLMTVHANLTILFILFFLWHVLARRFAFRIPKARDRRAFLRLGGLTLAGFVMWRLTERVKAAANWPGAERRFTGSYETGSFTGRFPKVSWLFDFPAPLILDRWQLVITGAVKQPLAFSYAHLSELMALMEDTLTATLDCTGGWYSTQVWQGISLGRLLDLAGLTEQAESITVEAVSGYGRRFPLAEARHYLLALQVGGEPLPHGHGFPLRLVAPDRRGFDWVKWVVHIRVNETGHLWQPPIPLQ